jgi:hypothetical protein
MLTINEYKSDSYNFIGYFDEDTNTTNGYKLSYPSKFITFMGKAEKVGVINDPELVDFVIENLDFYVEFKKNEKLIKGTEYDDIVDTLKDLATDFSELMAGFPNIHKANKVQDALYDIRFRNVDYLLEKIAKMDKEIGTLEEFEDTIPDSLYLRTLASKDDLKRFYKKNFSPISCRYDKNNPDVLTFYLNTFFSIDTYIKWLALSESFTLTDYTELYTADNESLNIKFTLRLDADSKTINENTKILNDFIELFNDFKDSIDD